MSSDTGASKQSHSATIDRIFATGSGVEVKLMGTEVSYGDGAGELDNKQIGPNASTADADWDVTYDASNRTVTVTNSVKVDFGSTNVGTVLQIVLDPEDGSEEYVVVDEPNDPQLTGEEYSYPAGEIEYVLGAV
jgi:hypothetical protein